MNQKCCYIIRQIHTKPIGFLPDPHRFCWKFGKMISRANNYTRIFLFFQQATLSPLAARATFWVWVVPVYLQTTISREPFDVESKMIQFWKGLWEFYKVIFSPPPSKLTPPLHTNFSQKRVNLTPHSKHILGFSIFLRKPLRTQNPS